jgi:hypothetical protein
MLSLVASETTDTIVIANPQGENGLIMLLQN